MTPIRFSLALILIASFLSGCSARKNKDKGEFPDEFAQGLEFAEQNPVDYVEADDFGKDLDFEGSQSGLIAVGDRKDLVRDDVAPSIPKALDPGGSIWDAPVGGGDLGPIPGGPPGFDSEAPFDTIDESEPVGSGITGGPVVGAPIGGGVVPPKNLGSSPSPTGSAPSAGLPDRFTTPDLNTAGSGASGLSFTDPPRVLADGRSGADAASTAFKSPGAFSLEPTQPDTPSGSLDLRNPVQGLALSQGGDGVAPNGGSRAAQAIGASGLGVGSAAAAFGSDSPSDLATGAFNNRDLATGGVPSPQPARQPANLPDAKTLKQQGIDQYKDRNFSGAITSFRDYLSAYSEDEEAVRAWLGYALMQDRRFGEASKEFNVLLNSGNPELRADAHFYLGQIHEKQGDFEAARIRWEQVIESYPNSQAAAKARKSLDQSSP